MTQLAFQALLAERQIPIHYGVEGIPVKTFGLYA